MNETGRPEDLHHRILLVLELTKEAIDVSDALPWYRESSSAQHLMSAAQSLFVAARRLESDIRRRYGEDVVVTAEENTL